MFLITYIPIILLQGYNTKPLHQFQWRIHTDQCNSLDSCHISQGNIADNATTPDYDDYVNDEGRAIGQQNKDKEEQINGTLRVAECAFNVIIVIFILTIQTY